MTELVAADALGDLPMDAPIDLTMNVGDAFRIALPNFEGPLDLLLHLIREHKLDILDIPVALITEKYIASLERMREVNLDIAGEFLVMAATLAHLKSRMLLPREEVAGQMEATEEVGDPRAELVRRLLDYQRYKEAAQTLARRALLGRDVFARPPARDDRPRAVEIAYAEVSAYRLIEALDRVLKAAAPEPTHDVVRERLSLSDAMQRLADRVRDGGEVDFFALFEGERTRGRIIVTFLAVLEMCKRRLIRIFQAPESDDIRVAYNAVGPWAESQWAEVDEREYR
ncbi:MAG: segregation and condensation protein A [Myxococcaceae bacterium]